MDFRKRLEQSKGALSSDSLSAGNDENDDPQYYAMGRGYIPMCLELRLTDGTKDAFPYATITEINFDLQSGIEIYTTKKRILITGRQLSSLFDRLLTYRLRYIQANLGQDLAEDGLFVASILIDVL